MLSFAKMAFVVDVAELVEQLDANPDLFDTHPERRVSYGSPHSGMSDIWVRFNKPERVGENFVNEHIAEWYPCIKRIPAVLDIAHEVFQMVGGEILGGVLITKLPAGGRIASHVDSGWHAEFYDKFYVSLKSPAGSSFGFECGKIECEPGEVYQFDNSVPHWVDNDSDSDRISLIVCVRTFERSINAAM